MSTQTSSHEDVAGWTVPRARSTARQVEVRQWEELCEGCILPGSRGEPCITVWVSRAASRTATGAL